ncbi:MAG: hypothetical protein IPK64_08070 [bacterium]|nr:hypothetical protein [bacterium]
MKTRRISVVASCLIVAVALSLLGGCRAFQPEQVQVNKAPETFIIGAPAEGAGGYYHFHVYWYGRDADGKVERFVWALTDTTIQDPDTTDDEEDQRFNPALDASTLVIGRWTTRTDSVFNFTIGQGTSISTNKTLHMVAVDDQGAFDRTPARLRFFTNTLGSPELTFFRVEGDSAVALAHGHVDTVGYGKPYQVRWQGRSLNVRGYTPEALALVDTVAPYDDGLFGYKWKLAGDLGGNCQPSLEDCWRPRRFNEATNDSFSFFGAVTTLAFANDGSGSSVFRKKLPSGQVDLEVNSLDIAGVEVENSQRPFAFIVNYDPETLLLDGEQDWAHPLDDTETYPYYIRLNDPARTKHPFRSGDRIPDRTYVVVKALARDNPGDERQDPNFKIGFTGYLEGVRQNLTGGFFPFTSDASVLDTQPAWDAGVNGWYGDTLGFLTQPNSLFTINMQAVDEWQRRDGSPASLSFEVGYEPCLQCVEIRPDTTSLSTPPFLFDTPCVEDTTEAYLAAHPCLGGTTQLRVAAVRSNLETDLQPVLGAAFTLVNKDTGFVTNLLTTPVAADSVANYVVAATRHWFEVRLHGKDDPAEAWSDPLLRVGGVRYEINYGCDPFNEIKDGAGNDDIRVPSWGRTSNSLNLMLDRASGLWKVRADVYVPTLLLFQGEAGFRAIMTAFYGPAAAEQIFRAVIRQFGDGWVEAVILDQTTESAKPLRPSMYNFFRNVRPGTTIQDGQTWRDVGLNHASIKDKLPLSQAAMASLGGTPVRKHFRLTLQPPAGQPIVCAGD